MLPNQKNVKLLIGEFSNLEMHGAWKSEFVINCHSTNLIKSLVMPWIAMSSPHRCWNCEGGANQGLLGCSTSILSILSRRVPFCLSTNTYLRIRFTNRYTYTMIAFYSEARSAGQNSKSFQSPFLGYHESIQWLPHRNCPFELWINDHSSHVRMQNRSVPSNKRYIVVTKYSMQTLL